MPQVNMHDAKTRLSRLVDDLESGREDEITIARNGRPVARLVRVEDAASTGRRIGVAKGAFRLPEQTEELDREAAALFVAEQPGGEDDLRSPDGSGRGR